MLASHLVFPCCEMINVILSHNSRHTKFGVPPNLYMSFLFLSWIWSADNRSTPTMNLLYVSAIYSLGTTVCVWWFFNSSVSHVALLQCKKNKKSHHLAFLSHHLTMMLSWFTLKSIDPLPFFFKSFSSIMSQAFSLFIQTVPVWWIHLSFRCWISTFIFLCIIRHIEVLLKVNQCQQFQELISRHITNWGVHGLHLPIGLYTGHLC